MVVVVVGEGGVGRGWTYLYLAGNGGSIAGLGLHHCTGLDARTAGFIHSGILQTKDT